jgi:hypothetical protein
MEPESHHAAIHGVAVPVLVADMLVAGMALAADMSVAGMAPAADISVAEMPLQNFQSSLLQM